MQRILSSYLSELGCKSTIAKDVNNSSDSIKADTQIVDCREISEDSELVTDLHFWQEKDVHRKIVILYEPGHKQDVEKLFPFKNSFFILKPLSLVNLRDTLSEKAGEPKLVSREEIVEPSAPKMQIKVLLVEDNLINQKVTKLTLSAIEGCKVDIANNGEEALSKFRESKYDLILMDCQMPVMDGFTATKQIRTMESGAAVPIIAMTANAFDEVKERCFAAGMDEFVTKPLRPEKLLRLVKETVSSSKSKNVA